MVAAIEKELEKSEKKYMEAYTRLEAVLREKEDLNNKLQA